MKRDRMEVERFYFEEGDRKVYQGKIKRLKKKQECRERETVDKIETQSGRVRQREEGGGGETQVEGQDGCHLILTPPVLTGNGWGEVGRRRVEWKVRRGRCCGEGGGRRQGERDVELV